MSKRGLLLFSDRPDLSLRKAEKGRGEEGTMLERLNGD